MRTHRDRGFTLIELLVVVTIIAIITAIGLPNLLNSLDRAKQKQSMADLRSISSGVEAYAVDVSYYPTVTDVAALKATVDPMYIRHMPTEDGWSLEFVVNASAGDYTLGSEGKDSTGGLTACAGSPRCSLFNDAIILINGQFVQWPEGAQQ